MILKIIDKDKDNIKLTFLFATLITFILLYIVYNRSNLYLVGTVKYCSLLVFTYHSTTTGDTPP